MVVKLLFKRYTAFLQDLSLHFLVYKNKVNHHLRMMNLWKKVFVLLAFLNDSISVLKMCLLKLLLNMSVFFSCVKGSQQKDFSWFGDYLFRGGTQGFLSVKWWQRWLLKHGASWYCDLVLKLPISVLSKLLILTPGSWGRVPRVCLNSKNWFLRVGMSRGEASLVQSGDGGECCRQPGHLCRTRPDSVTGWWVVGFLGPVFSKGRIQSRDPIER